MNYAVSVPLVLGLAALSACSGGDTAPPLLGMSLLEKLDMRQSLTTDEERVLKEVGPQLVLWVLEEACGRRGPWRDGVRPNSALLSYALQERWLAGCARQLWTLSKDGDTGAIVWLGWLGEAGLGTWTAQLSDASDRWCAVGVAWNNPTVLYPLLADQLEGLLGSGGETPSGSGRWNRSGDKEGKLLAMMIANESGRSPQRLVSLLRTARNWRREHLQNIAPKNPGVNSLKVDCSYLSDLALRLVLASLGCAESGDALRDFVGAAENGEHAGSIGREITEALRAMKWLSLRGVDWCALPGQEAVWSFLEWCGPHLGHEVYFIAGLASRLLASQTHSDVGQRAKTMLLSCLKQCRDSHEVDFELQTFEAGFLDDADVRLLSELRVGVLSESRWLQSMLK